MRPPEQELRPALSATAPPARAAAARLRTAALPILLLASISLLSACSGFRRPASPSRPPVQIGSFATRGVASWYGREFHGRRTASGERFDQHAMTAAHRTLPFGTRVAVTNLDNGKTVVVKINDRGPFAKDRILDLSYGAAREIGVVGPGTATVELALVDAPNGEPRYTVQVGAFAASDRASALHDQLQPTYPEVFVRTDGVWYRVQVGAFTDRERAESLRRELAAIGLSAFVIAAQ